MEEQPVETTLYSLATVPPGRPERRKDERHLTLLRVGSLLIGDRRELCLIRNISAGGMLIRAYSKIAPGTRLAVELKQGEPVQGGALWAEDDLVGIEFDTTIDVISLISTSSDAPRPRMPRIEVDCTVWIRDGAKMHRGRAVNVSQGGIRVQALSDVVAGAQVTVTLPGLPPEPGMVCWVEGDCCGITFNRVLDLSRLVAWISDQQEKPRAVA